MKEIHRVEEGVKGGETDGILVTSRQKIVNTHALVANRLQMLKFLVVCFVYVLCVWLYFCLLTVTLP